MNLKKIMAWLFVIIWLIIIFMFSAMDSESSNKKSQKVIEKTVEVTLGKSNDITTEKNITKNQMNEKIAKLNKIFRKFMHAIVYFILSLLLLNAFYVSGFKNYKMYLICIIFCLLYAILDEYHQTFVTGRTGQYFDVLIDMIGFLTGNILYYIVKNKIRHKF